MITYLLIIGSISAFDNKITIFDYLRKIDIHKLR